MRLRTIKRTEKHFTQNKTVREKEIKKKKDDYTE